jgi:hypothetical protein
VLVDLLVPTASSDEPFLIIDPEISVGADLEAEVCDFWDKPTP